MSLSVYDVVKRPVVTEKSAGLDEAMNQVVFEVDKKATKHQIREAIEEIFNVKVEKVRTMRVRGKPVRRGWTFSHKSHWKKAIVTLKEGDTIDFYEGV